MGELKKIPRPWLRHVTLKKYLQQMDLLYLISRISDRFENPSGHLFFHQNEILSSNLDRQTIYIIMLYLNHYVKDYENGFLTVRFMKVLFHAT